MKKAWPIGLRSKIVARRDLDDDLVWALMDCSCHFPLSCIFWIHEEAHMRHSGLKVHKYCKKYWGNLEKEMYVLGAQFSLTIFAQKYLRKCKDTYFIWRNKKYLHIYEDSFGAKIIRDYIHIFWFYYYFFKFIPTVFSHGYHINS